jgi:hypothetical protein
MTTLWYAPHLGSQDVELRDQRSRVESWDDANLIGSINDDDENDENVKSHSIVLDIDVTHQYVTSSTAGHGHLIVPAHIATDAYRDLLQALMRVGVVSEGYVWHASRREWTTFVRRPGISKNPGDRESEE